MKMTIEVAKQLVESLKNCPGIIPIDLINKIKFIELLTSVDINSASKSSISSFRMMTNISSCFKNQENIIICQ